jgi:1-acyl-sn-glycerol-3-phosphate acyltransferase
VDPRSTLRLAGRASACLVTTLGIWACLDAETALSDRALHDALTHKWCNRWARRVLDVLAVDLAAVGAHVSAGEAYPGRGDGPGRIFVMNHRSALDVMVMFALTQSHLVSRHDLASWPLVGAGARRLRTLFVDRASMRSGASVLKLMARTLEEGKGVAIFPEGTAFAGDEVRPFKPGAFRAAQRAHADIVPMGIAYADEAAYYGDESFGAHVQRVFSLPSLRAALIFGEPIAAGSGPLVELRDHTRKIVQQLVNEARAKL